MPERSDYPFRVERFQSRFDKLDYHTEADALWADAKYAAIALGDESVEAIVAASITRNGPVWECLRHLYELQSIFAVCGVNTESFKEGVDEL